jgi:hypothetical protein
MGILAIQFGTNAALAKKFVVYKAVSIVMVCCQEANKLPCPVMSTPVIDSHSDTRYQNGRILPGGDWPVRQRRPRHSKLSQTGDIVPAVTYSVLK